MQIQIPFSSSVFYAILFLLIVMLSIAAEKTRHKLFPVLIVINLTFVAGFRAYNVGTDTWNYTAIFDLISRGGEYNKEKGFEWISKFLLYINDNPTFLFLIYGALIYGLIVFRMWELRNEISFKYAIFSFCVMSFFETMNGLRQYIAVAFVFFATRYLIKRDYFKFAIFVLLGTLFHTSAILGFLYLAGEILFIKYLSRKQKIVIFGLSVAGILSITYVIQITDRYMHYFNVQKTDIGLRIFALLAVYLVSLFLFHPEENEIMISRTKQSRLYLVKSVRLYYLFGCALGCFGYFYDYMARLGWYFNPFIYVYIGMLVKEKTRYKRVIMKLMIIGMLSYILYQYLFLLNGSRHHPYHFIWD